MQQGLMNVVYQLSINLIKMQV